MSIPAETVSKGGESVGLDEIARALSSVSGVAHAEVRLVGNRVVGILTVTQGAQVTPSEVLCEMQAAYPPTFWPDQVLVTYQQDEPEVISKAA